MTQLRVGVNLSYLRPDEVGGSEMFVRSILTELGEISNLEVLELGLHVGKSYTRSRRLLYDNHGLSADLEKARIDVVWHPANIGSPLVRSRVPQVLHVQDLIHRRLGRLASETPIKARDALMRASIHRAKAVTALSDTTRNDLVELFGMKRNSIVVIGAGVDVSGCVIEPAVKRWPYVIYPAMLSVHKNHGVLIEALRHLHDHGHMIGVIFTGKTSVHETILRKRVDELGLTGWVEFRGFVPRSEVLSLLSNAEALVYPSLYEGFGLPLLEAMALGVPTVTSGTPALVDTAGGASVVISAHDALAWARAIAHIIGNSSYRAELVRLGESRASEHTWVQTANLLAQVLSRAAVGDRDRSAGPARHAVLLEATGNGTP